MLSSSQPDGALTSSTPDTAAGNNAFGFRGAESKRPQTLQHKLGPGWTEVLCSKKARASWKRTTRPIESRPPFVRCSCCFYGSVGFHPEVGLHGSLGNLDRWWRGFGISGCRVRVSTLSPQPLNYGISGFVCGIQAWRSKREFAVVDLGLEG